MKVLNTQNERFTTFDEESFKIYMTEINKYPLLTPDEEVVVGSLAKEGDKWAIDYLVKCNLRFVISVAKQYISNGYKLADLVNEGNIGLIKAANRFDPSKGFKFISYAVWWIRRTILDYKVSSKFIKLSTNRVTYLRKFDEVKGNMTIKFEREPTDEEIIDVMEEMGITKHYLMQRNEVLSIDKPVTEDGLTLNDKLYNSSDLDSKIIKDDIRYKINSLLNSLPERNKIILELSYGLNDNKVMTLEEIGDKISLTREAVRLIRNKTLNQLRKSAKKMNLDLVDIING